MSKTFKSVGSSLKSFGGQLFGGSGSPGMLGTGRYKGSKQNFDQSPFKEKLVGKGSQETIRGKQVSQGERLEKRAKGESPSIAEAQLKQASNRSLAQQLAAAKSRRGGSAGAQQRMLAKAAASERQKVSEMAATERLKEQQLAEQSLAQQLQARRAQDINIAESDRASAQKLQELLVNENLGVQGLNLSGFQSSASQRSGLLQKGAEGLSAAMSSDENVKTKIKSEGLKDKKKDSSKMSNKKLNSFFTKDKVEDKVEDKAEEKKANFKFSEALTNSGDGAGESALKSAMSQISDEDNKKEVKEKEEDFNPKSFLDALKAYSYEYKDSHKEEETAGEGRFLSPMAQDIEKAGPVGKSMVKDTPNGKVVDYGKGFGAILAAQAHLNERLKDLESKKK